MKKPLLAGFAAATLAAGGAFGTQEAEATSVNQVLLDLAKDAEAVGSLDSYRFQDRDFGVAMESDGETVKTEGDFEIGDIVRGSFFFRFAEHVTSEEEQNFGDGTPAGDVFLFGRYSLQIEDLQAVPIIDQGFVEFGPDPTDPFGTGDDRMFELYESTVDHEISGSTVSQDNLAGWDLVGDWLDGTRGGFDEDDISLWGSAGILDDDDEWSYLATEAGAEPVDQWYANDGDALASGQDQILSWIDDPSQALDGHLIGDFSPRWLDTTDFSVEGISNDEVFGSVGEIRTQLEMIPTPSAALAGLMGVGVLALVRGRRERQVA